MSVSQFDISKALRDQLLLLPSSPPLATEGASFDPTVGEAYIKEINLGGDTTAEQLNAGLEEVNGVYQIDIYTPSEQGKWVGLKWADDLNTLFPHNLKLTRNEVTLRVKRLDRAPLRSDGAWLVTTVSVYYQAYT